MVLQIAVEHPPPAKNPGVLGVQAEHQTDAQRVEAFQRLRALRVLVLLEQGVIEDPHNLARLQGDLHLLLDAGVAGIHQELQAGILALQVGQAHNFRVVVGAVHIVNLKF